MNNNNNYGNSQAPYPMQPSYGAPAPSAYGGPPNMAQSQPLYGMNAPMPPPYGSQNQSYGAAAGAGSAYQQPYPPSQAPYGAPYGAPQQPPYGAPQQPPYGAPQQPPYGAPQRTPFGAPQQPPYGAPNYGSSGYSNNNYPGYRPQAPAQFDERNFIRKLFDDIDSNHDGRITGQELHEALRRGQPTSDFDPYTITTLIEKYDSDRDNQISFNEFNDLFLNLNAQFNEFLDFDSDSSGSIDGRELGNILRRKGYNFSPDLFNYIVYEISRRSGRNGINFDTYVRVIARFDFLRAAYSRGQNNNIPLEKYIRDTFF